MKKTNINNDWQSWTGASGLMATFFGGQPPEKADVDLPHDSMLHKDRSADAVSGSGGGYFPGETYNYTKTIYIPETARGDILYLEFEGVFMYAHVEINGNVAGKHVNGYTGFQVKINDFVEYGKDNEIRVTIKNTCQPNSRWYSGAGIYRNVYLLQAPPFHIEANGLRIRTIDCDDELAVVRISADIQNDSVWHRSGYVISKIKNGQDKQVAEVKSKINLFAGQKITAEQNITLTDPQLWSVDDPNLYSCEITLVDLEDNMLDSESDQFGIRKLRLDTMHGLRINGRTVKLKGGCIHHDNGLLGACAFEDAEERRVKLLKDAGYNAVRSAHNPISKAFLDACDRLGMMVMDEFSDTWTRTKADYDYAFSMSEWWELDLESMIRKDYNHPSVILYSIGNEIPECGSDYSADWGRKYIDKIRSLDDTRYITNGLNVLLAVMDRLGEITGSSGGQSEDGDGLNQMMNDMGQMMNMLAMHPVSSQAIEESCDMLDVVGYNYSAARYELDHKTHPERICVGTETSPAALDVNWDLVKNNSHVIGDFSWTAWDYLGETGIGAINYMEDTQGKQAFMKEYPWINAYCGDLDITGHRKPVSYWREVIWGGRGQVPYAAVQPPQNFGKTIMTGNWSFTDAVCSWTWPGFEGKDIVVEAYADAEEAELFVNGKTQGRIPVGDDFKKYYCKWQTKYEPGKVEVVSYVGKMESGRFEISTAQDPKLTISQDKDEIRAGSNDLCYIDIELKDENGVLNMTSEKKIKVSIDGPGTLAGCGSADPKTEEKYNEDTHMTYQGRMQAIIRAGKEKGIVQVKVASEGMDDAMVQIDVV